MARRCAKTQRPSLNRVNENPASSNASIQGSHVSIQQTVFKACYIQQWKLQCPSSFRCVCMCECSVSEWGNSGGIFYIGRSFLRVITQKSTVSRRVVAYAHHHLKEEKLCEMNKNLRCDVNDCVKWKWMGFNSKLYTGWDWLVMTVVLHIKLVKQTSLGYNFLLFLLIPTGI